MGNSDTLTAFLPHLSNEKQHYVLASTHCRIWLALITRYRCMTRQPARQEVLRDIPATNRKRQGSPGKRARLPLDKKAGEVGRLANGLSFDGGVVCRNRLD